MSPANTRILTMRMVGAETEAAARARILIANSFRTRLNAYPNSNHKRYLIVETMVDGIPTIAACSSITFAHEQKLFSETYFPGSLQEKIAQGFDVDCERRAICEIGSLSTDPSLIRSVKHVVAYFPWFATRMGCEFALVTVTSYMRLALAHAGAPFEPICFADPSKLTPEERVRWGNYYNFAPQAGLIDLKRLDFLEEIVTAGVRQNEVAIALGCFGKVEACS
jgi:hypothetical protein